MANNNDVDVIVKRRTRNMTDLGDITDDELPLITVLTVRNGRRQGGTTPENKPLSSRIGECTNLDTLHLKGCSSIPVEILSCTMLSSLILDSHGNEDNDCRIELPEAIILHKLISFHILGDGNWNTDEIISWLAMSCPNLTNLNFRELPRDTTNQFMRLLQDHEAFIEKIKHKILLFSFMNCNLNEDDLRSVIFDIKPLYPRLVVVNLRNNNIESIKKNWNGNERITTSQ